VLFRSVNTDWFRAKLAERELSMRGLAKKMELDPASISLMLRGMRRMTTAEANKIAVILGISVTEILRQAGVPVSEDAHTVALTGTIDANGKVKPLKGKERHQTPPDVPTDGIALQVRCPSSAADGWLVFCASATVPPDSALERLCVVNLKGGDAIVGTLRKGYNKDTYNIICTLPGNVTHENQTVKNASTVLWVRPR
jgi:plasmid maintenance system antidote protein VapI